MDRQPEAVVALREGATVEALRTVLRGAPVRLLPMFPGATDAEGRRWHLLVPPPGMPDAAVEALLATLRAQPAVDAAYLKPAGEPPADASADTDGG